MESSKGKGNSIAGIPASDLTWVARPLARPSASPNDPASPGHRAGRGLDVVKLPSRVALLLNTFLAREAIVIVRFNSREIGAFLVAGKNVRHVRNTSMTASTNMTMWICVAMDLQYGDWVQTAVLDHWNRLSGKGA